MNRKYDVGGMSCAACSSRVEKAVSALDGVEKCSVNLLTGTMEVSGDVKESDVISAVTKAGYTAKVHGEKSTASQTDNENKSEVRNIALRLIFSLVLLVPLMYISMGHHMFGFPLPPFLTGSVSSGIAEMLLSGLVMVINQKFFISGFKALKGGAPNMDTLVSLGSGASFIYSAAVLIGASSGFISGEHTEYYFESAAMILALITVGKLLEAYSKGRTTDAIKSLMKMTPDTAHVIDNDGNEMTIDAADLKLGDIFVLRPGDRVPADAVVIEGFSTVDESMLTGESIPVDKETGSGVAGGSINVNGFVKCRATGVGADSAIAKIIKTVNEASSGKAPISKKADDVAGVFVPIVMAIALATLIIWLIAGESISFALTRAVSVLVISCPCSLGLATPVAVMVGSGIGAGHGILFKSAEMLEEAGKVSTVVFDKTGTLTTGQMALTDIIPINTTEEELIKSAYALEEKSEHPLSKAICNAAKERNTPLIECRDFISLAGKGISAVVGEEKWSGGSVKFAGSMVKLDGKVKEQCNKLSNEGKTPLIFIKGECVAGIIAVSDTVKSDSSKAIRDLEKMKITPVMLTGDNARTASAVASLIGIKKVKSDVLPEEKEALIKELLEKEKIAMVGDGVNDAPALTRANIGIAIGAGTDVAIDSADIVLTKNDVSSVVSAIRLSRQTLKNIKENLFWAFFYNSVGIPVAAGVLIKPFGIALSPMLAAAAMSLSSFCVVMNALRLNLFKFEKGTETQSKTHNEITYKRKENEEMEKTMKIEGMMCSHCEARVKKALEELENVSAAAVSHESGSAKVKMTKEIDNATLEEAVKKQGYNVTSIE